MTVGDGTDPVSSNRITYIQVLEMFAELKKDLGDQFDRLYSHLSDKYVPRDMLSALEARVERLECTTVPIAIHNERCRQADNLTAEVEGLKRKVYAAAGIGALVMTLLANLLVRAVGI